MTRARFGLILGVFIFLVAVLITIMLVTGKKTPPAAAPIPTTTPTPTVKTVDDLYRVEGELNAINLDSWQDDITANDQDLSGKP